MTHADNASPEQPDLSSSTEFIPPATWFDLITVDVVDPVAESSFWAALLKLEVQQNEDDGRWIVLADATGRRVLGFQRCDQHEVASRQRGRALIEIDTDLETSAKKLGAARGARRRQRISPGGVTVQFLDDASGHADGIRCVVDVVDPVAAAGFWADVTGLHVTASNPIRIDVGREPESFIAFRRADQPASPTPIHWDLECEVDDFDEEIGRLLTLGATRIGPKRQAHFGIGQIMADPQGLLFCANAYTPAIGMARGRPAAVTIDTPVTLLPRSL